MSRRLLLILCALATPVCSAVQPLTLAPLVLPASLPAAGLEMMLQSFVDQVYLTGFRHLGDERDFDHGHILADSSSRPLAILYHTQELALGEPPGSPYSYLDPKRRNWIQWLDGGRVEDAALYRRTSYPKSPSWDLFRRRDLPGLDANGTILDRMLDPELLAIDVTKTTQWVFTRIPCGPPGSADSIRVSIRGQETVCLALSSS